MIKTILFDVDGVFLSEERYFDASALTVWEMLYSPNYLALKPGKFKTDYNNEEITEIRKWVFQNDQILKFQKSRGLNANWDMIYLTFSHQLIHLLSQIKEFESDKIVKWCQAPIDRKVLLEIGQVLRNYSVVVDFSLFLKDFERTEASKQELLGYLNKLAFEKLGVKTSIFLKGELWSVCEHVSQEWYVGDEYVLVSTGRTPVQIGKKGFLANETTLAPKEEIAKLFEFLKREGYEIGIGTGRPELETIKPFVHLDWLKYFDVNRIVTADDVLRAEEKLPEWKPLSKPHPFTYLMGLYQKKLSVQECLDWPLPIENGESVLIVGDSLADFMAAQQMGAKFAAVLTGLSGKAARAEFEAYNVDFILDSVVDLKKIL
ncbi:HAD family hydrolase [Neobacillus thermocopriae]|uniref:HAD hydrolase-like protein n=1 Tax=Neobacillus thermocopriae TaxID=1215031 RepID=A0A6B3TRG6_9BACI|nr:HAD hydrolase-like protein [Neobacillus thermocopriae]MED3625394.1 HAD hydrolase-like protein [Neobacillus thermocopriae]MED3715332.1 HAD hydrolase-like protein [Neobacillus thermocopriae]NEX79178.1 HAD hydrolase-like protein [Neobacillus thermocopriae]